MVDDRTTCLVKLKVATGKKIVHLGILEWGSDDENE